jgi:isocitrate/isopropylmalate dehydrogenase
MLEHMGHPEAGGRVLNALEDTLAGGTKTRDLGGSATTEEMTEAVIERLRNTG